MNLLVTTWITLTTTNVAALPFVTGTFSDLSYHEDSGDLLGIEFKIVYSYDGHFITLQCSGGIPVTKPVEIEGSNFSFALTEANGDDAALCGLGEFAGRIEERGLWYWTQGSDDERFVPRRESYWEKRARVFEESASDGRR